MLRSKLPTCKLAQALLASARLQDEDHKVVLRSMLRKFMLFLGIFLLSGNLALASVPRCSVLKEIWNATQERLNKSDEMAVSCHEPASEQADSQASLSDPGLCQCHLLNCLVYTLPTFAPDSYIRFIPSSEKLLVFPFQVFVSDHVLDLEAPPPRV